MAKPLTRATNQFKPGREEAPQECQPKQASNDRLVEHTPGWVPCLQHYLAMGFEFLLR